MAVARSMVNAERRGRGGGFALRSVHAGRSLRWMLAVMLLLPLGDGSAASSIGTGMDTTEATNAIRDSRSILRSH